MPTTFLQVCRSSVSTWRIPCLPPSETAHSVTMPCYGHWVVKPWKILRFRSYIDYPDTVVCCHDCMIDYFVFKGVNFENSTCLWCSNWGSISMAQVDGVNDAVWFHCISDHHVLRKSDLTIGEVADMYVLRLVQTDVHDSLDCKRDMTTFWQGPELNYSTFACLDGDYFLVFSSRFYDNLSGHLNGWFFLRHLYLAFRDFLSILRTVYITICVLLGDSCSFWWVPRYDCSFWLKNVPDVAFCEGGTE